MHLRKPKFELSIYVFVLVITLITFLTGWCIATSEFKNIVYATLGVVLLEVFAFIVLVVLIFSIMFFINSFRNKYERGTWKKISTITKFLMIIICAFVFVCWFYWTYTMISNGLQNTNDWVYSMAYETVINTTVSGIPYIMYLASFIGLVLWSVLGISLKIVKNTISFNKKCVVY